MMFKNGKCKLVGLVNLGGVHAVMRILSGKLYCKFLFPHASNRNIDMYYMLYICISIGKPELATHVLQFVFLSDNAFQFPIAQHPSGDCTPSDLYFIFWEGVLKMLQFGFV